MENNPHRKLYSHEREILADGDALEAEAHEEMPVKAPGSHAEAMRELGAIMKEVLAARDVELAARLEAVMVALHVSHEAQAAITKALRRELFEAWEKAHLADVDALTGLLNRHGFLPVFQNMITGYLHHTRAGESRTGQQPSFLQIDLDGFKQVNDTFGHAAGDLYLTLVGENLRGVFKREGDLVVRLGGDEFGAAVMVPNESVAREKAEEMHLAVARASQAARKQLNLSGALGHVSASIGYALFDQDAHAGPEDLMRDADYATYVAKHNGKNRVISASDAEKLDVGGSIATTHRRQRGPFEPSQNESGEPASLGSDLQAA